MTSSLVGSEMCIRDRCFQFEETSRGVLMLNSGEVGLPRGDLISKAIQSIPPRPGNVAVCMKLLHTVAPQC
eukprot:1156840-Prorocentrum_lima.AAC.1